MYTPTREQFIAAADQGNLIPVYRELLADGDTPVSAFAAVGGGPYSFLLESVVGGATWAAYSFVGVAPRAVITWHDGTATTTWHDHIDRAGAAPRTVTVATSDPTDALVDALATLRPVAVAGLPRFWGGAVGLIAYNCVRAF
jgi:anthranilate synthase component I